MTKRSANGYPEARSDVLLTEAVGDELVIFDTETNEAHALKPLAAAVFTAADGLTPVAALAGVVSTRVGYEVGAREVDAALAELDEVGLLVGAPAFHDISRRRLLQVGGAAAAGVLVSSAVVPALAAASTPCAISQLSQFGILIFDGTDYFFVVAALAGATSGTTVTGTCSTSLGGASGGTGSDGVCWHNLTSLPGPGSQCAPNVSGQCYKLAPCGTYNETITFTVSGSSLIYTVPYGTTVIAWWLHNGTTCYGPESPSAPVTANGGNTYVTDPCNV